MPEDLAKDLDLKIVLQTNEWWQRDAAEVNGDIAAWTEAALVEAGKLEAAVRGSGQVGEPEPAPGPQYSIVEGQLSIVAHLPAENELSSQASLHQKLRQQAAALANAVGSLENQYPALVNAIKEYADVLTGDIEELDVTAVWSVGGALASFQQAYAQQNSNNILEIPLEPNIVAQLQSIVRMHGAFIMGFGEGRELIERADAFLLDTRLLQEIEAPGNQILNELSNNQNLVDDETRAKHIPVRDAAHELGWGATRNGYAAYAIVRNGTIALTKFLVGKEPSVGGALGLLAVGSVILGDPTMEFSRNAVLYLQVYGSQLLSFFNHSPEMRAYIEYALKMIVDDANQNIDSD